MRSSLLYGISYVYVIIQMLRVPSRYSYEYLVQRLRSRAAGRRPLRLRKEE